jgi:molecular chaperone DnaK
MEGAMTADAPHTAPRLPVIGIDLGTTMSVVAAIDQHGKPFSIPNQDGDLLTPTAVLVDQQIIVGREAVNASVMEPEAYADCFKRDVGSPVYCRGVCGVEVPPQVLSAFVLDQLRQDAQRRLGPVRQAVITVPAFFDESRRKATQDAGRLAGLDVLDIINEPTAAALAYGYQQGILHAHPSAASEPTRILVYDLGGGTFDVTILEISGTKASGFQFRAIATDGDVQLGGKDFDARLVEYLAEAFVQEHHTDPRQDPHSASQLWIDAQRTKHTLSQRSNTSVVVHHAGLRSNIAVTRELFEQLTCDLLERTETTTSLVVREAGLSWDQIDRVLLVGGSSRMPAVSEMLQRVSGREVDRSLSPDEAVAHGAALHAANIIQTAASGASMCKLININSHSLGVRGIDNQTRRPVNGVMIPKNTALPCTVQKTFSTIENDQQSVRIVVLEGESHRPEDCIQLGDCVIRDLPPGLPKGSQIEVAYRYGTDGRLAVSARLPATRRSASVEIRRNNAVELEDLDSWRQRLLATDSSPPNAINTTEKLDPGTVLRRLDDLYAQIGNAAIKQEMTVGGLIAAHRAACAALAALSAANTTYKQAVASQESTSHPDQLAHAFSQIDQCGKALQKARSHAKFACIVLGRECVKHNQVPSVVAAAGRAVEELRARVS